MADNEVDVVVIGAGMGGLTAAALLSNAGLRVKIIEEQEIWFCKTWFLHCEH